MRGHAGAVSLSCHPTQEIRHAARQKDNGSGGLSRTAPPTADNSLERVHQVTFLLQVMAAELRDRELFVTSDPTDSSARGGTSMGSTSTSSVICLDLRVSFFLPG